MNNDRIKEEVKASLVHSGAAESRPEKETNVRLRTGLKAGYYGLHIDEFKPDFLAIDRYEADDYTTR